MNVVMIIPTGIGCEIGGHAGDATPAAKLLAACCDKLILHPNVVNASDINEMPENALYVEGSILDRFLEGKIELKEVLQNKILVAVNPPIHNETVNAVQAAQVTVGADIEIIILKKPLRLIAEKNEFGCATGQVSGWHELIEQVKKIEFDVLAIATPVEVKNEVELDYWKNGGVNPWGGVEAKASKLIANELNKPVAHAPVLQKEASQLYITESDFITDPRMSAEIISWAMLHCVLKGLHRAPRIGKGLRVDDISCLVTPFGCVGRPHKACLNAKIPVIAVKENTTILNEPMPKDFIQVDNYLEAAGLLMAMQAGINHKTVKRPISKAKIIKEYVK